MNRITISLALLAFVLIALYVWLTIESIQGRRVELAVDEHYVRGRNGTVQTGEPK